MQATLAPPNGFRLSSAVAALIVGLSCTLVDQIAESGPYAKFYGIVHLAPRNRIGTWVIGTRTIATDQFTEFYAFGGSLAMGSCAGVVLQGERALEIDAAPMDRCRSARSEWQLGARDDDSGARA
jgi:hypothetical protein